MSSSEGEKKKFQTFDPCALKPGVGMDFIYCEESKITENFAERNVPISFDCHLSGLISKHKMIT